jgi:AMMECR1 domain-containing protein
LFEVTILSPPQSLNGISPAKLPLAIEFGRDALMIVSGLTRAILLPQTAMTKCKDSSGVLAECCVAAGLSADAWVTSQDIDLVKFQTQIFREKSEDNGAIEVVPEALRK